MSRTRTIQACYLLLLALCAGAALHRPAMFQKVNALRPAGAAPALAESDTPLAIAPVIEKIPYTEVAAWAVAPQQRYERTMVKGGGNCSQRSFGLAYELDRIGSDFQIVHLLPLEGFLGAGGHTVLRARYELDGVEHAGLIDLHHGGIPTRGGRPIDIDDLSRGAIPDFRFITLNPDGISSERFYGPFLETAVPAYILASDVHRYFRFLEGVYVPLGPDRLEKYVWPAPPYWYQPLS
ncbi:MAG: hypothetical protein QF890_11810 [Myxococcota bacterium]|nr:hypothetical protein [bacterium]MDP6074607.1 hypothetical protein [Myxococcota bacterium]MCP4905723.1 hypothetical protein [bacterium]MDP7073234.1 hypothetical protein [Myxococcota bacterium]MDP7299543.1 hypothetical protein [Myxococcota bacterium]